MGAYYLVDPKFLEPKIMVLGIFAARKFAVGKLAARNFRCTEFMPHEDIKRI